VVKDPEARQVPSRPALASSRPSTRLHNTKEILPTMSTTDPSTECFHCHCRNCVIVFHRCNSHSHSNITRRAVNQSIPILKRLATRRSPKDPCGYSASCQRRQLVVGTVVSSGRQADMFSRAGRACDRNQCALSASRRKRMWPVQRVCGAVTLEAVARYSASCATIFGKMYSDRILSHSLGATAGSILGS
jgi:hypothetical protein